MTRAKTRHLFSIVALASFFLAAPLARAVGLGAIRSHSRIGQYFEATIPVVGIRASDLRGLRVRLASRHRFLAMGLEKSAVLYELSFHVEAVPHHPHRGLIVIRSLRPIRVAFLTFVLHVRWPSGVVFRTYTVLLRPPLTLATTPAVSSVSAVAVSRPPVITRPSLPAPRVTPPSRPLPPLHHVYGPVRSGETLWGIAHRLRPEGVSTDQMMMALYRANPHAFIGNINLLRAGYVLRIPGRRALAAIGRRQAVAFVLHEDRLWITIHRPPISRSLELLTPTVLRSRARVRALERTRRQLSKVEKTLARTRAALVQARKTIAALRHQLVLHSMVASRLAHAPPPSVPQPRARRPTSSFPWMTVLLILLLVLLVAVFLLRRQRRGTPRKGRPEPLELAERELAHKLRRSEAPHETLGIEEGSARGPVVTEPPASPPPPVVEHPSAPSKLDPSSPRSALLAEVDFSLAYGLHDQAIESLERYLADNPGDEEIHAKLLEAYAHARDTEAFVAAALTHRTSFGPEAHAADIARWAESLGVKARLEAAVATAHAETATTGTTEIGTVFEELLTESEKPQTATASLDDALLPPREATIGTATETALDFDLDLTDFEVPASPTVTASPTPSATESSTTEDTQSRFEESLRALRETVVGTQTNLGEEALTPAETTATDAVATKLSLARAYLDMGDHEGARALVEEILHEGTPEQQAEARQLLERIRG